MQLRVARPPNTQPDRQFDTQDDIYCVACGPAPLNKSAASLMSRALGELMLQSGGGLAASSTRTRASTL
jgi:hypothetical protein